MPEDGKISLFSIVSDEKELDVNVLPKTIHPIESFDNPADAIEWINQYDNRNS
jgi:hypothetical protein